ncbi:Methyltransferase type 11 [Denitrovibrio acetiphilus DSM 12809]|uniref:Methyltransferase type 11 n=1 Tax=Denitrovibrio acetiphilus (strain DSM 12809 / NBRC 114555 / N2460) TaxID=522772 RepID=D4H5Q0_DENA2|nr:class I SAM-dependent methyltransferase [Denitrovibrio acetiphilus]ADD69491.1 Methyltransferase type 11 [Denitrovibrio acetiphilus DSM 12809]
MGFDRSAENYLRSSDHAVGSDLEYFEKYFAGKKFQKALDIACAAGHFGASFPAELIYTADYSFNMLKTARDSFGFDMPVRTRGEFLPFLSDTFDLVGCRIAMHHFTNPCLFMNDVFRVLKTGGYFVLIDSVVGFEDAELNKIELIRDTTHRRSFKVEEVEGMALAEGFHLEDSDLFYKEHIFDEWARRPNPSEEQYRSTVQAFLDLPDKVKAELRLKADGKNIISYTDKKAVFIFRKST